LPRYCVLVNDPFVRDGIYTALGELELCLSCFLIAGRNRFLHIFDCRAHFGALTDVVGTALLGLAVGDDSAPGVGEKPLSAIPPKDRTTPAGRFVGYLDHDPGKPNFLWVDYKNNVSLHRVVKGRPQDQRAQRLASPTPLDNRISFGCINVPIDFFDRTVLPTFKGTKGIVYVLPEIKAMRDFFSKYSDVNE